MTGVVVAGLVAGAVLLLGRPQHQVPRRAASRSTDLVGPVGAVDTAPLRRARAPLAGLAVVGGWVVLGGVVGVLVGIAAGVVGWRVLEKVESPSVVRRRRELERDLPMAVHLYGAALAAGSATGRALDDVVAAMPGAVADQLALTRRRLDLGADPVDVWGALDGPLRPWGRSMARAHESGSSVLAAVEQLAVELRAGARQRTEALARSIEVRASAPLGICFLPAFVLLGVVPMVAGIFSTMTLFG